MKKLATLATLIVFVSFLQSNAHAALREVAIASGYTFGDIKKSNAVDEYKSVPIFMQFGWELNSFLHIDPEHKGTLQFVLEPFVSPVMDPLNGVEVGLALMTKYDYPITDSISPYVEFGSGPMYLGVDTIEQGHDGFNFVDQVGGGIHFYIAEDKALNVGYRFRHISHAGVRTDPNNGINSHSITAGFSFFYF